MYFHIFIMLFSLCMFGGCQKSGKMLHLSEKDRNKRIEIKADQEFTLTLKANPTTGYTWKLIEPDSTILKLQGEPAFKPDSDKIGSGGELTFRLQARSSGKSELQLHYIRPWEKDQKPLQSFVITIIVKSKSTKNQEGAP